MVDGVRQGRLRPALVATALIAAIVGWAVFAATPADGQSPPAGVGAISVSRDDGTLTASWSAPANAAAYHVTYTTTGGASWALGAMDHAQTNWTLNNADNSATYVVGVRARNSANVWGGWTNSASIGPFTPAPPAGVGTVSVSRGDGTLTASWSAPANAAAYHVTYTTTGGASWALGAMDHDQTNWTLNNADNSATYIVGVRARNSANVWGGWTNSASSGPFTPTPTPAPTPQPPPAAPASVSATRGDGYLDVSWSAVDGASGYHINTTTNGTNWQRAASDVTGTSHRISAHNDDAYYVAVAAVNAAGTGNWTNSDLINHATLTTTAATTTTATIAIGNWNGAWYYQTSGGSGGGASAASNNGGGTCTGPVQGSQTTITSLDPNTSYTINAYGNGCTGQAMAQGQFNTAQATTLTAQHITATSAVLVFFISPEQIWYYDADSGPHTNCSAGINPHVNASITGLDTETTYTYRAYTDSGCAKEVANVTFTTVTLAASEVGATTVTLTLNGGQHGRSWWYAETGIFPTFSNGQPFPSKCHYAGTASSGGSSVIVRNLEPANGNSSIPWTFKAYSDNACANEMDSVDVNTLSSTLTVQAISNGVRLTLNNWGTNDPNWHYRVIIVTPHHRNLDVTGSCAGPVSGNSVEVTNRPALPHHWSYYIYKAYDRSDCHYSSVVAGAR